MEKKTTHQVVIDLDTCADFYDFCVENDIEIIVAGVDLKNQDAKTVTEKLTGDLTRMVTVLLFKRKLRALLQIITRNPEIDVSLPEARGIISDFFIEYRQQSADLMRALMPVPTQT